jgi:hypothetical protein
MTDLLLCPYCGKSLSSKEYEHAIEEFKSTVSKEYKDKMELVMVQHKREKENFDKQTSELHQQFQVQIESAREKERNDLKNWYKQQIDNIQKTYEELNIIKQKELRERWQQQTAELESEIYEKDNNLQKIQKEIDDIKRQAIDDARHIAEKEISIERDKVLQKDIQLKRAETEVDKLKRQLCETTSELKGEIGELKLYENLTNAFPEDIIERTSRGVEAGDIIHHIKTKSGKILDTAIIYDNKDSKTITPKDIEKAKRYMDIHATEYVIIVSRNLPKRSNSNSYWTEKDGISLIDPAIIVPAAIQIRKEIIRISKLCEGNKEQNTKQSLLYDHIRSSKFSKQIEVISEIHMGLVKLQNDDERSFKIVSNKRKALYEKLMSGYLDITGGIDAIIEEYQPPIDDGKDISIGQKY